MAVQAFTDGYSQEVGVVNMFGSYTGNVDEENMKCNFQWGYGDFGNETSNVQIDDVDASFSRSPSVDLDRIIKFRAKVMEPEGQIHTGASSGLFKTYTDPASASTPVISAITSSSADASCDFDPGTLVESSFSVQLQYRQLGSGSWINFGSPKNNGTNITRTLTGLLGGTVYEVRMHGTRTTANDSEWDSPPVQFTTIEDTPVITTIAGTVVTDDTAILNGSVDPNNVGVKVYFGWGDNDGGSTDSNWDHLTAEQSLSGDGTQGFEQQITGLSPSTTYFFRAFCKYPSPSYPNKISGSTLSFVTPGVPLADDGDDHMHIYDHDGHYGVAHDVYFTLSAPSGTSSDRLVTTAPGSLFGAGDVRISKDGGAPTTYNEANIVQVAVGEPFYKLPLSASDMQAEQLTIIIRDVGGPLYRDLEIKVRTKQRLGQLILNSSQVGASASAFSMQPGSSAFGMDILDTAGTGIGQARGIFRNMVLSTGTAQGGGGGGTPFITLQSGTTTTNDYFNGDIVAIVSGVGAGQSRVIVDYDGSLLKAIVNSDWATPPNSTSVYLIIPGSRTLDLTIPELTAIPSAGDSAGKKLQFCYQRFAFKVTQTATLQTLYNFSGSALGTRSVSDDGTTQTIEKVA